jgi:hypothetical protein
VAIFLSILIVPGMIVAYAMVLRPLLHGIPQLQKFYADADGFWAKVWAICGKSVTVAWGYILGGVGSALALVDPVATELGDPGFKDQVSSMLQSNPKVLGYVTIAISVITIAARLRSIAKV